MHTTSEAQYYNPRFLLLAVPLNFNPWRETRFRRLDRPRARGCVVLVSHTMALFPSHSPTQLVSSQLLRQNWPSPSLYDSVNMTQRLLFMSPIIKARESSLSHLRLGSSCKQPLSDINVLYGRKLGRLVDSHEMGRSSVSLIPSTDISCG